jgi:hypothetical protein
MLEIQSGRVVISTVLISVLRHLRGSGPIRGNATVKCVQQAGSEVYSIELKTHEQQLVLTNTPHFETLE